MGELSGFGDFDMRLGRVHRDEGAQGLVEFAFLASALMLVFLGTIDFSRFLYYDNAITSAARVGAERAGNHCTPSCGQTVTTVDYVVQAAVCEANIGLKPAPLQGCSNCTLTTGAPIRCNDPYNASSVTYSPTNPCSPACTQDVYVNPALVPNTSTAATPDTPITVTVGYGFKPIAPLMNQFFSEVSCYPGDSKSSNHHTLCATAFGREST
jgi:TadE-like protein